ncbi:MAG: tripartite tricarboxylate transporter permease [Gammaproteobacteria bacterium]|nr:tripartite tricarboxylate transporter permease [Gammaproteobacteria bacterium]
MFEALSAGLGSVFALLPLLTIVIGIVLGILIGAMPGLSPSMGVALMVPFTYAMSPTLALILLVGIYIGSSYGGSITGIMVNAPGTPSAVVTAIDGYALTRQGKPSLALGTSIVASSFGGMFGTLILIGFSVPLAAAAVRFHPSEYFAFALFGMATIATLAGDNWGKAFIGMLLGLLLATVGTDPISGAERFTFDVLELSDGFLLIPALIGMFALSEVFAGIEKGESTTARSDAARDPWPRFAHYWKLKWVMLRASAIGTLVGVFPGAGATIGSFISYGLAKRFSRKPDDFGKGSPEGVTASEAADSGSVGGAMVPLLALGIPGSATTAVLIGAMMIHDLTPGPQLFVRSPEMIYAIFGAMLVAQFVLLFVGMAGGRLWVKVALIPKELLYVLITMMAMIGSFAVRNAMFDVFCCLAFGLLGWVMRRYGYPLAPVILGLVLGTIAETNFRRAIMMDGPEVFFTRPITAALIILALLSFLLPLIGRLRLRKQQAAFAVSGTGAT